MPVTPDPSTRASVTRTDATPQAAIVMAFDYGERRIGVAVGQRVTGTATPLATITRGAGDPGWTAIAALVEAWRPHALVVGQPRAEHDAARNIRSAIAAFRIGLEKQFALPVYFVDEAYSSVEACERLKTQRRAGTKNKRIDRGEIDRVAAAILLEAWMSATRGA